MHHSPRPLFFLIFVAVFTVTTTGWCEEIPARLLSRFSSEDGRAIELLCHESNPRCVSASIRFTESGRSVGHTGTFSPSPGDTSTLTLLTRTLSSELGAWADFYYGNIFNPEKNEFDLSPGAAALEHKISSRMLNKTASVILQTIPPNGLYPAWSQPLDFDFFAGEEIKCLPTAPRRQIGRGILEQKSGKSISLQCLDLDCKTAGMVLTPEPGSCDRQIGPAFHLKTESVDALRDSLIEAMSARFHFADQLELLQIIRKDRTILTFQWKRLAPEFIENLIDLRALKSIIEHEVNYWQFKPRKVEAAELNRWLSVFSDAPYLHTTHSDRCRFGTFSFSRDDQHMDRFIQEAKLGVFDGLDEFLKLKNGQWGEAESNTFYNVIQPLFERYITWEASAYFTRDPRELYRKNKFSMNLRAYRIAAGKSGFKLTYNATSYHSEGDIDRVSSRYEQHTRRDGRDLPRKISRIARHMRCD